MYTFIYICIHICIYIYINIHLHTHKQRFSDACVSACVNLRVCICLHENAASDASGDCACNAGYTGPNGGTCTACPAGKFKAQSGPAACSDCPSGTSSSSSGAVSAGTCFAAYFFDASVVRYPSSYSYPGAYATRSLTPVPGYAAGSCTFTAIDISISSFYKYRGGVLGPNGLIYFVPYYADNIGVLNPSSSSFTTIGIANTISGYYKYRGGVLGPNGLIYFVPDISFNIGKLHLGNTQPAYEVAGGVPQAWSSLLSPHFNKL